LIPRYALPAVAQLLSDQTKYATWVRVEILATQAQVKLGRVPADVVPDMERAPVPTPQEVTAAERERDHEVLAFLAAYCGRIPEASARWVHVGMTSYDLVDTAQGYLLSRTADLVLDEARRLRAALVDRAVEHWDTVCVGRTHGIHAEPTTFGQKLSVFAFEIDRSVRRLVAAREAVAVGTISGSVGTYSLIDPYVEQFVCRELGLEPEQAPSQVVARDRHAQLVQALALLAACVEHLALELRLLQRTEVREVEEPRSGAYQGSSAMPHKRNPTTAERLAGLARLQRAYANAVLEDVALWHERDLAHSSVERVALLDALTVGHYQTSAAADLVAGLEVFPERMAANLEHTGGLIYSSAVLADLLEAGVERERAYRTIQAAADRSIADGQDFRAALRTAGIDTGGARPERFLANHGVIRERLELLRESHS